MLDTLDFRGSESKGLSSTFLWAHPCKWSLHNTYYICKVCTAASLHARESGFQNTGYFSLVVQSKIIQEILFECEICNPGLWNPESRILLMIGIQNPSSTDKVPCTHTWNLESTVWNPESKTVLDSLTSGDTCSLQHFFYIIQVFPCTLLPHPHPNPNPSPNLHTVPWSAVQRAHHTWCNHHHLCQYIWMPWSRIPYLKAFPFSWCHKNHYMLYCLQWKSQKGRKYTENTYAHYIYVQKFWLLVTQRSSFKGIVSHSHGKH